MIELPVGRGARDEHGGVAAARHRLDAVLRRTREAEALRRGLAVDREGRAGAGARAERALLGLVHQAEAVLLEHLDVAHQHVAEQHRLRALQVRVEGHDRVAVLRGEVDQRGLHFAHARLQRGRRLHQVQTQVGRDLVVAAARGVQALSVLADQLGQAALDGHVDVLVLRTRDEGALVELARDLAQARDDAAHGLGRQDAGVTEHLRVRDRADDVLGPQALVHLEGAVDGVERGVRAAREAPARVAAFRAGFALRRRPLGRLALRRARLAAARGLSAGAAHAPAPSKAWCDAVCPARR
jgi:hypothetical protein